MRLNFYPVQLEFDEYILDTTPFSIEKLSELRKLHNSTHSFFRQGDDIFISNKDGDEKARLGTPKTIKTYGQSEVTSSLIKHIFFRTFKDRFPKYTPIDFYPFRFFSEQVKDDIIYPIVPDDLKNILGYKKLIEVQLRYLNVNGKPIFGFVLNIMRNWVFSKNCEQLVAEGFQLKNLDVLHAEIFPGLENILAPNEEYVGRVLSHDQEFAEVETNQGTIKYPLTELFLKKTRFNIGSYLTYRTTQRRSDEILNLIEARKAEIYNPKRLYGELNKIATLLFSAKDENNQSKLILFENKDGFTFTVNFNPLEVSNTIELKTPTFIFDHAATKKESSNPDKGLNNFGPYDSISFDVKSPAILCICHKDNRGAFTRFLAELKDGIPTSDWFKKGFQKKYDLTSVQFLVLDIPYYDVNEYIKAIRNHSGNKPDAAIVEIPSNWRELKDVDNPYYKIKAKLLALEIPLQYVTYDKIRASNEYILNSIGLQLYAKLGGTPWVLPSNRSVDREIVIGIGHSWLRQNQYSGSANTRVVGITTFLSSDGQYLLSDKVREVVYEDYFEELLRSLKTSIALLEKEQAWNEGDTVRLIFHIFKPIKNVEFDVVAKLVGDIRRYRIQFAFVTISKKHPFLLFDPDQKGVPKYRNSTETKGEFIPIRTSNIFLDTQTCLIQMLGPKELKTDLHGMSTPIQVKIRTPQGNFELHDVENLMFSDLAYVVQQIFSFTYLSWRSFLPGEQPATMLYSSLMSHLLGKLRKVDGWDPDSLNYKLKRKKWFL